MKEFFYERDCLISKNKAYRWSLSFKISKSKKEMIFIGLNPSLSDFDFIDNTSKKIIKISKNHNYGKIKIINLFALISKTPNKLLVHQKPIGYLNNKFINQNLKYWSQNKNCDLWLGWGNNGTFLKRDQKISKKIIKFYSIKNKNFVKPLGPLFIKKTNKNNPIHPLYCRDNSNLQVESS